LIAFIINPIAGGGRAYRNITKIENLMNDKAVKYKIFITTYAGEAEKIAKKAAKDGYKIITAVGGDGTVHEVINGIRGTKAALGVIPLGTGNDFARYFKIPKNIEKAIDILLTGNIRVIDGAIINDIIIFDNITNIGLDAEVASEVVRFKKFLTGILAYLVTLFNVVLKYKPYNVDIKLDDLEINRDIMTVAAGVLSYYGGGFKIIPHADPSDGYLDIVIVNKINKFKLIFLVPLLIMGRHTKLKFVEIYRAKDVEIRTKDELTICIDGEIIKDSMIKLKAEKDAINLCTI